MEYRKENDTIYLRIDKGEEVMETIALMCKKESLGGGFFQGIGACNKAVLSTWIVEKSDFISHTKEGMLEMISLMGNVSIDAKRKPVLHAHGVFSFLKENGEIAITAGHVKEAFISYTGEIIFTPTKTPIGRKVDKDATIEVWALS